MVTEDFRSLQADQSTQLETRLVNFDAERMPTAQIVACSFIELGEPATFIAGQQSTFWLAFTFYRIEDDKKQNFDWNRM